MGHYDKIRVEHLHDSRVLKLVLNSPKGNVLDKTMLGELVASVRHDGQGSSIKALVISGEGTDFCFGASVPQHEVRQIRDLICAFHELAQALIEMGKPMFALVRGKCLGGGMELAAFCHWIFASSDALFGQPEIKLAAMPLAACLMLPHRIGQVAADDIILTGRTLSADEALRIGFVQSVSADPEKQLDEFILKYILPKSTIALKLVARACRHEMYRVFLDNYHEIERLCMDLVDSDDASEGVHAFLERRQPIWRDR